MRQLLCFTAALFLAMAGNAYAFTAAYGWPYLGQNPATDAMWCLTAGLDSHTSCSSAFNGRNQGDWTSSCSFSFLGPKTAVSAVGHVVSFLGELTWVAEAKFAGGSKWVDVSFPLNKSIAGPGYGEVTLTPVRYAFVNGDHAACRIIRARDGSARAEWNGDY